MHYLRSIEDRLQNHNSPARLPDQMYSRYSQLPKQLQPVGGMLFIRAGNQVTAAASVTASLKMNDPKTS
jgi:hypothetical protein